MPELPEVETVRRMLDAQVRGRTIRSARLSRHRLREPATPGLARRLAGRTVRSVGRRGKYLLVGLDGGLTLLSHLGMSGRWLFHPSAPASDLPHVHARIEFEDGSRLWFQDPRRFGLLRLVPNADLAADPALAALGPDPLPQPPTAAWLGAQARGLRSGVKSFLMDQRRVAGIGNIYASEILHRAGIHPERPAGTIRAEEWRTLRGTMRAVLGEAIAGFGTTFSMYRTLWNEPGTYGDELRVYDRAGEACRSCGQPVRRILQGQRSTFLCPVCQPRRPRRGAPRTSPPRPPHEAPRTSPRRPDGSRRPVLRGARRARRTTV